LPLLSRPEGSEPTFKYVVYSLAQSFLLVGVRSGVIYTDSTISIEHHLTRASHHWESHPPIKVNVALIILIQLQILVKPSCNDGVSTQNFR
jgi:hypothetical protein